MTDKRGDLVLAIGPDGAATGPFAVKSKVSYVGDAEARRPLLFATITAMSMATRPAAVDTAAPSPASTTIAACDTYRSVAEKAKACSGYDDAWDHRLAKGIARVNRYATTPPIEGAAAAAHSCARATDKVKAVLASAACAP